MTYPWEDAEARNAAHARAVQEQERREVEAMQHENDHPTPAQWAAAVAVRDIVARLDARPAGNLIGHIGRDNVTRVVEVPE